LRNRFAPAPFVDHAVARRRTLEIYRALNQK
jgi:hypothetical protein